jgi:hypothetical protein
VRIGFVPSFSVCDGAGRGAFGPPEHAGDGESEGEYPGGGAAGAPGYGMVGDVGPTGQGQSLRASVYPAKTPLAPLQCQIRHGTKVAGARTHHPGESRPGRSMPNPYDVLLMVKTFLSQ